MEFALLGPLEVRQNGRLIPVPAAKHRVVLATLLMRPGEAVHTDTLAERLWGDAPLPGARKTVQGYIARLRRRLGENLIETRPAGYAVVVAKESVDLQRFEQTVERAEQVTDAEERSALLSSALALWRGAPLTDIPSEIIQRIDVARLAEARVHALGKRINADLELGRHTALVPELRELVSAHPYHEDFARQLIIALHRSGRRADALTVYRTTRAVLIEEIGVEPSERLNSVHDQVLSTDGAGPAPPPRVLPAQFPPDAGDFVGRRAELGTLLSALASGRAAPVVCVSGAGGVGKTTLAVHAGQALRESYPDGRLYADLAATEPADVLGGFLEALGVTDGAVPASPVDRAALFRSIAATRKLLVLLDNAPGETRVRPLLPGGSSSATIITSRTALVGLTSAGHLRLSPPSPAEAIELLVRTAGPVAVDAESPEAAEVATLCGCLPLAIRIAGGKLLARTHRDGSWLAARLRDESTRLDELAVGDIAIRTTIDRSYRRLDQPARAAFGALGRLEQPVFTARDADVLLQLGREPAEALMDSLADHHLLEVVPDGAGEHGYRFPELTRLFARELSR